MIALASPFDLTPHLLAMARRPAPTPVGAGPDDDATACEPLALAQMLSDGGALRLHAPGLVEPPYPAVVLEDDPEAANVTLLIHRDDPRALAAEIELRMSMGERIAIWDARYPEQGDEALLQALLNSIVYLGSLAAVDTRLDRVLAPLFTPLRDGLAFRRYLAHTQSYAWVWRGAVRGELARRFGDPVPRAHIARAEAHARARMGAYLARMQRRGLRFEIGSLTLPDGHLDAIQFTLAAI